MCGLTGIFSAAGNRSRDRLTCQVEAAAGALRHRGPDDGGTWVDAAAGIALGHRRLSIIDLSPAGAQPMLSPDGRYVIIYNGEIYNFATLRAELDTGLFRGGSDTEVLLAAIMRWGLADALCRANGMFALALWDRRDRCLHLARDRFGQKPLYYSLAGGALMFGSELRALRHFPDFDTTIDRNVLSLLLRHSAIPAPYSIYRGCRKLMPGTTLRINADDLARGALPEPVPYWSATQASTEALGDPCLLDDKAAIEALEARLRDAVGACMVSDVPIGAFLSGGIDSSTVVALMQAQSAQPVRTFSIGFTENSYNEAHAAAAVAGHLGTSHTELYITPADAQAVIPDLPSIYDEPFADSSQIPTYLVSRLARQHVTVSISGDGGDELFGGYNRYTWARNLDRAISAVPLCLRRLSARGAQSVSPGCWDAGYGSTVGLLRRDAPQGGFGDRMHKLAEIIDSPSREDMYWRLMSQWKNPGDALIDVTEPPTRLSERAAWPAMPDFTQQIMLLDALVYLPDDILVKLDRASMAVGLESRVPLLDHRLFEFAWRLPQTQKIRDGKGKWILREVLARHVPRHLFERPKMGFGVPIGAWLRGDLREWADNLLCTGSLRQDGFFNPGNVEKKWQEHLSGARNHQHALWPILMFEAWRRNATLLPETTATGR